MYEKNLFIIGCKNFIMIEFGAKDIGIFKSGIKKALPIDHPILGNISSPPYNLDFSKKSYGALSIYENSPLKFDVKSIVLTNIA